MPSTDARTRTPSVSELQAALEAARRGVFAGGAGGVGGVAPGRSSVIADAAAADAASAESTPNPVRRRRPPPGPPPTVTSTEDPRIRVWLLGVHGGSGARCLASVLPGTRSSNGDWPTPAARREQVVLVCRTSYRGLTAAQDHARRLRDGQVSQHLDLLGVIVNADAPGRVPLALRRLERLVSGAVPVLGEVPWQPAWRLGPVQPFAEPPAWLTRLLTALQQAVTAAVPR